MTLGPNPAARFMPSAVPKKIKKVFASKLTLGIIERVAGETLQ